jgi:hypothetical protein
MPAVRAGNFDETEEGDVRGRPFLDADHRLVTTIARLEIARSKNIIYSGNFFM